MKLIKYSVMTGLLFSSVIISGCFDRQQQSLEKHIGDLSKVVFDDNTYPAVILGGGVAGLTAAVYFSQANIPCAVIQGPKPGGALGQSHSVRNWPGVLQAPGIDIVDGIKKQAGNGGVEIFNEKVVSVNFNVWPREIIVQDLDDSSKQRTIKALTVFIGMGTEPNLLGIPGETGSSGYWGDGVSNCAVCEGSLYKNRQIAIVGGGDAAITEADYLADIASHVFIMIRKNYFRAKDTRAKDKVLAKPNVTVLYNTEVREIMGDDKRMTHVIIVDTKTNEESSLDIDGLFLAIGSRPNTLLFKEQLAIDDRGFLTLTNHQETSVKGIFAGGDVSDSEFVQAVTASSDGCKAALQAIKFLKELGFDATKFIVGKDDEQVEQKQEKQRSVVMQPAKSQETKIGHNVIEIKTEKEFQQFVLNSVKPVVLDLFATWCIPCQQMLPIIEKLAQSFKDDVLFVKLNVSSKSMSAEKLLGHLGAGMVRSVPTFIFIKNGKEIGRLVGGQSFDIFKRNIETVFK